MERVLSAQALAEMGARVAVLCAGRYALPVPFRVRDTFVECRVPNWSGVCDTLEPYGEVLLVAVSATPTLQWLFIRGTATPVADPDWTGLEPPALGHLSPDDLYQLLRIAPTRIERIDERRGWGYRETADL